MPEKTLVEKYQLSWGRIGQILRRKIGEFHCAAYRPAGRSTICQYSGSSLPPTRNCPRNGDRQYCDVKYVR